MKNLKHLKHMLATWAFNGMSSCCFDELRLVVVEVDGGVWSSLCGGGTSNSPMGRLHTKLTALACLLEHPLWRLAGSVEVAAANGPTEASTAVQCGVTGSVVEVAARDRATGWRWTE
jgi:hypothetical protein